MLTEIIILIMGLTTLFVGGVYFRQPMGLVVGGLLIATAFWSLLSKGGKDNKHEGDNL